MRLTIILFLLITIHTQTAPNLIILNTQIIDELEKYKVITNGQLEDVYSD